MNRWIGLQAIALVAGLASSGFGQFGGMGGGMGNTAGGRVPGFQNFGAAGKDSAEAQEFQVKILATDGKATAGTLRLTSTVIGCAFGIYEIKPDKVQEIRFGGPQGGNVPVIQDQAGLRRFGQVVTATGEVIDGTILIPSWWRVETDLGVLAPNPEMIKSIAFSRKAAATPPAGAAPPTGGNPPPDLPPPPPTTGPQGAPPQ